MRSVRQILKYSGVNAVLLPLNLSIAWALTEIGLHYLAATVAGFAVQITIAFFINRAWTFRRPEVRAVGGITRASIVEIGAILVVLATTTLAVEFFGATFLWARLIAVATSGIWCYVLDSRYTFRAKRT